MEIRNLRVGWERQCQSIARVSLTEELRSMQELGANSVNKCLEGNSTMLGEWLQQRP